MVKKLRNPYMLQFSNIKNGKFTAFFAFKEFINSEILN